MRPACATRCTTPWPIQTRHGGNAGDPSAGHGQIGTRLTAQAISECAAADQFSSVRMLASDVGCGPEYLLRAITAILLGADSAKTGRQH